LTSNPQLLGAGAKTLIWLLPIALFGLYFAVVSERYPVHTDQILSADRAISMLLGTGYTTNSWPNVAPGTAFAVSNSPLHDVALFAWTKIFGPSIQSLRGFNYFLAAIIALLLALGSLRHGILGRSDLAVTLLLGVVFSGPLAMSYGYGRYDTMGILISALAFFCASVHRIKVRKFLLFGCGFLLSLCGIQFAAYGMVISLLVIALTGGRFWREILLIGLGGALGVVGLVLVYAEFGVLDQFISNVLFTENKTANVHGRVENIARAVVNSRANIGLILILAVVAMLPQTSQPYRRTAIMVGMSGLLIPVIFSILGNYTRWYAWMAYLPLVLGAFFLVDKVKLSKTASIVAVTLVIAISMGTGAPKSTLAALLEWDEKDIAKLERFMSESVEETDVVLCDAYTYLVARTTARTAYSYKVIHLLNQQQKEAISKIVYSQGGGNEGKSLQQIQELTGGEWRKSATYHVGRGKLRMALNGGPSEPFTYSIAVFDRVRGPHCDRDAPVQSAREPDSDHSNNLQIPCWE
jgi:hypothetical protein